MGKQTPNGVYHACGEESTAMKGPAWAPWRAIVRAIWRRLSSHAFNERSKYTILSGRPWRTSLILTLLFIRISLSKKKSNSLNSPSRRSSFELEGNAESGTGGSVGLPFIASASRYSAKPPGFIWKWDKNVTRWSVNALIESSDVIEGNHILTVYLTSRLCNS